MTTQNLTILKDLDPMPFGQYEGVPLLKVPAEYLLFLYAEWQEDDFAAARKQLPGLVEYIEENIQKLTVKAVKERYDLDLEKEDYD